MVLHSFLLVVRNCSFLREFSGSAVVRTIDFFTAEGLGSILGQELRSQKLHGVARKHKTNIKPKPKAHILSVFNFTFSSNSFHLFYLSLG